MDGKIALRALLNREYLPVNKNSVVYLISEIIPPTMTSEEALPMNCCLLIDRSLSMYGEKLQEAKKAAKEALNHLLPGKDTVGLVMFAEKSQVLIQQKSLTDYQAIEDKIEEIKVASGTALYKGLEMATDQLKKVMEPGKRMDSGRSVVQNVILISDGQPTDNKTNEQYRELSKKIREAGITVIALGIGADYNEDLLGLITNTTGGSWYHVQDPKEIRNILSNTMQNQKTVLFVKPELYIRLSMGVSIQEAFRTSPDLNKINDITQDEQAYKIPLGDVKANEPQTLVFKLAVPPRNEGPFRLGQLEVLGGSANVICNFTSDPVLLSKESNPLPRNLFSMTETTVMARRGVGGDETAIREAERRVETLVRDPNALKNKEIIEGVTKIREALTQIKVGGVSEEAKKALKEELTIVKRKEQK